VGTTSTITIPYQILFVYFIKAAQKSRVINKW